MSTGACLAGEEAVGVLVAVSAEKVACAASIPDFMAVCVPCVTVTLICQSVLVCVHGSVCTAPQVC